MAIKCKHLLLSVIVSASLLGCRGPSHPPNILFILVDDLGWMDTGFNNPDTFYDTPNLDRLAKKSLVFTSAYTTSSVSSPTRASIMTGKYPARLGITDFSGARTPESAVSRPNYRHPLLPARFKRKVELEETTVAEALKENGYSTFFAGKWAIGPQGYWPENQGFDVNKGGWTIGAPQTGKKYFSPYDNPRLENGPDGEHLPDRLASETIDFISSNGPAPFFAYLSFYSVHTPLMTRDDLRQKYEARVSSAPADSFVSEGSRRTRMVQNNPVYAGMVESVDLAVGRVLRSLERLGLSENTIIIFYSDNGGLSTSEGHPTSNYPLRAGKGWLFEGGVRVPMFIHWPGVTDAGGETDQRITSTDFFPTILDLVGADQMPLQHTDGVSFVTTLERGRTNSRNLFWHYPHYSHQGGTPSSSILSDDFKYIEYYENKEAELFNIREDIGESTNLIQVQPGVATTMKMQLDAWLRDVKAVYPTRNPNRAEGNLITHPKIKAFAIE